MSPNPSPDTSLLVELIKETNRQIVSLRESIDVKLENMSARWDEKLESHADKLDERVEELDGMLKNHHDRFQMYDHWMGALKWVAGGGLAGMVALWASISGWFSPHKH